MVCVVDIPAAKRTSQVSPHGKFLRMRSYTYSALRGACDEFRPGRGRPFRTRWLYFALFIWNACAGRFMSLYYFDEGLSPSEIGALFSMGSFTGPFISTAVCTFADRCASRHPAARHWFCAACVVIGTIAFTIQAVHIPYVSRFSTMMVCSVVHRACNGSAGILTDAITVTGLQDRKRFGKDRTYGAVSWAIMHVVLGILIDAYGRMVQHAFIFVGAALVLIVLAVIGVGSSAVADSEPKKATGLAALTDTQALGALLRSYVGSKLVIGFCFYAIALGFGMTIVENLVFLFFRELGASYFLCGVSVVVTVVFEVPLFHYSDYFLDQFGTHALLVAAGVCYSFRVVGYTLCPGGWSILLFEPMHGVTIACWGTASMEFVASTTPKALIATGSALLGFLRGALGSTSGTSIGGYLISTYGENTCYRTSGAVVLVGLFVYGIAWLNAPRLAFEPVEEPVEEGEPTKCFEPVEQPVGRQSNLVTPVEEPEGEVAKCETPPHRAWRTV